MRSESCQAGRIGFVKQVAVRIDRADVSRDDRVLSSPSRRQEEKSCREDQPGNVVEARVGGRDPPQTPPNGVSK